MKKKDLGMGGPMHTHTGSLGMQVHRARQRDFMGQASSERRQGGEHIILDADSGKSQV